MPASDENAEVREIEDDAYLVFAEAPPMAEEVQALGREGVAVVKRWLEATTHIRLDYDVYDFTAQCIVPHFGGREGIKRFDLAGQFTSDKRSPVYVECKRYRTPGGQAEEFKEFLRIAYSSTLWNIQNYTRDRGTRFLWVTTHPFSQKQWVNLETHSYMRKALEEKPEYLGGSDYDDDRLREVAERIMVLVFNPKQKDLSLTIGELLKVRTVLDRS